MSSLTTINASDQITNSRTVINNNFSALNTDKVETSVLDTDTSLAADSDSRIATQKAVKAYVDFGGNPTSMTGVITAYGGSAAPTGWLLCNGSAVSRTTYANLFAVTSTTFGAGNGSSTFNLPNLQNRIPMGAGSATVVATFASRASNVITVTGLSNNAGNEFQTGQAVFYASTSTVITGLTDDTTYYLVRVTNTSFSLATSVANANAGTVITLSGDGAGVQTFTLTFTTRTAGEYGGEESHALNDSEMASHAHTVTMSSVTTGTGFLNGLTADGNDQLGISGASQATGSDAPHNNLQPFCVVNYIIKT